MNTSRVPRKQIIKSLLASKGLAQITLKNKPYDDQPSIGISKGTIDKLFGRKAEPISLLVQSKLAIFLDVSIEDIFQPIAEPTLSIVNAQRPAHKPPIIKIASCSSVLSQHFIGSEDALHQITSAWLNTSINILNIYGIGGIGKSALVSRWLSTSAPQYHNAEYVLTWSFTEQYDQDYNHVNMFIRSALQAFNDPQAMEGTPQESAHRLATYIRKHRSILILEGLEVLIQQSTESSAGYFRQDDPLLILLHELAMQNNGLCILCSRQPLKELQCYLDTSYQEMHRQGLSDTDGIKLLKTIGIQGNYRELIDVVQTHWGHPLCLNLIGQYIVETYQDKHISHYNYELLFNIDQHQNGRIKQIMKQYERCFNDIEKSILTLLSLSNQAVSFTCIKRFFSAPVICQLNEALINLSDTKWLHTRAFLMKQEISHTYAEQDDEKIDIHPIAKCFFRERLRRQYPESYKTGRFTLSHYTNLNSGKVNIIHRY